MLSEPVKTVFISYSWDKDGEQNESWVINLAERLSKSGIKIFLDKWDVKKGDPIAHFMQRAITGSDKVLMICTPNYKKSADALKGAVGYETNIIATQIWLTADHRKYISIIKEGTEQSAVPVGLQGKCHIMLNNPAIFEAQYMELLNAIQDCKKDVINNNGVAAMRGTAIANNSDFYNLSFGLLKELDKQELDLYMDFFRKAIIKKPWDDKAHFGLGLCSLHYKLNILALRQLQKAVKLAPGNAEYHYYYALSLCKGKALSSLAVTELADIVNSIKIAIQLNTYQAKYYCFMLLVERTGKALTGLSLTNWSIGMLQQKSHTHFRDEFEIERLISLVSISNAEMLADLFPAK